MNDTISSVNSRQLSQRTCSLYFWEHPLPYQGFPMTSIVKSRLCTITIANGLPGNHKIKNATISEDMIGKHVLKWLSFSGKAIWNN